jgi:hypothetical protein
MNMVKDTPHRPGTDSLMGVNCLGKFCVGYLHFLKDGPHYNPEGNPPGNPSKILKPTARKKG